MNNTGDTISALLPIAVLVLCVAAWMTHVFTTLTTGAWGILIAGAILFPIGIIHGIGLWFGLF